MSNDRWALLIAILSFLVSVWTLYRTELSPFKLTVAAGTPGWRVEKMVSDGNEKDVVTVTLPIMMSNSGAHMGIVQDMVLALHYSGRADHLVPAFFADASSHTAEPERDESASHQAPMFRPIILRAREQNEKAVVFVPQGDVGLRPGRYSVTLNVKALDAQSNRSSWQPCFVGSFELTEDDVLAMAQGHLLEKASIEVWDGRNAVLQRTP